MILSSISNQLRGHGGIGRHASLRCLWAKACAGSSPVVRNVETFINLKVFFIFKINHRKCKTEVMVFFNFQFTNQRMHNHKDKF